MEHKTPQDLENLFRVMQGDVELSHHLSDDYLEMLVDVIIGITENCESKHEDGTSQWKGFKCMRNGLRDIFSTNQK